MKGGSGGDGGSRTAEDRTANRREGAGNACTYDCGLRGVRVVVVVVVVVRRQRIEPETEGRRLARHASNACT